MCICCFTFKLSFELFCWPGFCVGALEVQSQYSFRKTEASAIISTFRTARTPGDTYWWIETLLHGGSIAYLPIPWSTHKQPVDSKERPPRTYIPNLSKYLYSPGPSKSNEYYISHLCNVEASTKLMKSSVESKPTMHQVLRLGYASRYSTCSVTLGWLQHLLIDWFAQSHWLVILFFNTNAFLLRSSPIASPSRLGWLKIWTLCVVRSAVFSWIHLAHLSSGPGSLRILS